MSGEDGKSAVIIINAHMAKRFRQELFMKDVEVLISECIERGCKIKNLEDRWKKIFRYYKQHSMLLFDIETIGEEYIDRTGRYQLRFLDERNTRLIASRLNSIEDDDIFWLYKELREERKIGDNRISFIELLESITVLTYITEVAHKEDSCLLFILKRSG